MSKPLLVFIHIPKTAGMTLINLLEHNCKKYQISRWSHWKSPFLDYMNGDESQFHNLECIHGHGSITDFENLECFKDRPKIFITMLRDPVQRTLSYYYHTHRKPEKHGTIQDKLRWLYDVKKDDYFNSRINSMTYNLSGDKILNNESLEKAKYFLSSLTIINSGYISIYPTKFHSESEIIQRQFHDKSPWLMFFGITEHFDKSIRYFKRHLNLKTIQYEIQDVNKSRPKREEDYLMNEIRKLNCYDVKLYNWAKKLFERRIK